jgi:hypothetical protein
MTKSRCRFADLLILALPKDIVLIDISLPNWEHISLLNDIVRSQRLWSSLHGPGWIGAISQVTLD